MVTVKRGRGRPAKVNPRTVNVGFKVTPGEYQYLWVLAQKQGRTIGETVRSLALVGMAPPGRGVGQDTQQSDAD